MSNNYILEFQQIGKFIKVVAFDQATLTEAAIVLPAGKNLTRSDMSRLAVKRLEYILNKKKQTAKNSFHDEMA